MTFLIILELQHKPELVSTPTPLTNAQDEEDEPNVISSIAATAAISTCAVIVTIPLLLSIFLGIKHLVNGSISEMRLKALKKRTEKWNKMDYKGSLEEEGEVQQSRV